MTRPVIDGVSVRVIGIWLGLQSSKADDRHGNANGEAGAKMGDLLRKRRADYSCKIRLTEMG